MENTIKKSLVAIAMVLVGATTAMADTTFPANFKVGVVDVNAVVSKSAQVQALKTEQQQKLTELQKWLETVRADVEKQQTKEGKEKLIKKYDAEFTKKQETIKSNYAKKLQAIDVSISKTIAEQAKAKNYNMIFATTIVSQNAHIIKDKSLKLLSFMERETRLEYL